MRVDELVAGVKADVAVLLYGDDLTILGEKASRSKASSNGIAAQSMSKPTTRPTSRRSRFARSARHWPATESTPAQVMETVVRMEGDAVGHDLRRSGPLSHHGAAPRTVARRRPTDRTDARVDNLDGKPTPLGTWPISVLKRLRRASNTKPARRRTFVSANVRGRDVASFVAEAQKRVCTSRSSCPPDTRFAGEVTLRICNRPACG